jgi:hypothetical protein
MCMLGLAAIAISVAACGDNTSVRYYENPDHGALRLVLNPASTTSSIVLDLVVGDQPLTGYSVGFDLPLDADKVKLASFTAGTALPAGDPPMAAIATIATSGPLRGNLVTGQSQKASGAGAVTTDTTLAPGAVLYTIRLDLVEQAGGGVVFDGTAPGFALTSGGLRDRLGNTVVEAKDVAIGKLTSW